ncbi:MAG: 6-hydroxycyclohex-1-ene-1-carbonyl-CoA dehydrogenase [Deltaproteobacteria bacterium]|nr:6-hydroxycyclohex-1-ene-1-carbonyl-CoA dehydrogenase [Deltaproteobacteria bacterium]
MKLSNSKNHIDAYGYFFTAANQPLERRDFTIPEITSDQVPDQVVVEVAGCGLCHTDIGFITGSVKTKHEPPLILGHEISGRVVAAGPLFEKILGKNVIIPAVLPCGECELCRGERDNICQAQKMPGNDFHGGFASHIAVPGRFLCELPSGLGSFQLPQLSVVADAVTTPYQSLKRSGLKKGDLAIVIGTGGIGIYMVQHAKNAGASVIALDIDGKKLEKAREQGADAVICTTGLSEKDVKDRIRALVAEHRFPKHQWKVFETSGSAAGQSAGFSLLSFAGVLGIVGFTMEKLNVRLSNVMAYDADVFGNWGCRPAYYAPVVQDVLSGKIKLRENIREYPLDSINEVIPLALAHKLEKRAIFKP